VNVPEKITVSPPVGKVVELKVATDQALARLEPF
jgi:hypothetical protein